MSTELTHEVRVRRRNAVGLRQAMSIAHQLGMSDEELARVLALPASGLHSLLGEEANAFAWPDDLVQRMGYLLSIWRWLVVLFPTPQNRRHWLHATNQGAILGGRAPINVLLDGGIDGLRTIRDHLASAAN